MKITIIGAGSAEFTTELITDFLATPALQSGTFALVDIDPERLEIAHKMAEWLVGKSGKSWDILATTDRKKVLSGSDFVINTIEVAGLNNVRHDYDIPLKYGVDQCIGDTIGPGGLFKALRTLPAWIEILKDVERLCPKALVMNYTNPMSLTVLTGKRAAGNLKIVGLCHSVQSTLEDLSNYLDIAISEISYKAAGINHLAWFTKLEKDGESLYPLLKERIKNPEIYEKDPVRFEMMKHLGAFVTESSGHTSEYTAYFRKRPDLIKKFMRPEYRGESGFYANNWPSWREESRQDLEDILSGKEEHEIERGKEFASYIVEAMITDKPTVIYANVLNTGLIDNLPKNGVVEVPSLVDRKGIQPTHFGSLPPQLASLDYQHMMFHDLVATAVLERDREAAVHALMVDPLSAAVLSLEEIRQMFDEMVKAESNDLPEFLL